MSFNVKVKFFGRSQGNELTASVSPDMTVRALKESLAARVDDGVAPERLKLIYLGRVMSDDHTVGQYGVAENQVLHMVVKPADAPEQPARPQPNPATEQNGTSGTNENGQETGPGAEQNPFAGMGGMGGMGGAGAGGMGGLFSGLLQNLQAATPMMAAAISRAQQAAQQQQQQQPAGTPQSGNRSPAPQPASDAGAGQGNAQQPMPPQPPMGQGMGGAHHHVFVNAMPQQPPVPQPQQQQQLHVHVHVTMDELRELPERLNAFNARMARNNTAAQVHVRTAPNGVDPRAAAAQAAAHPDPATSRPQPAGPASQPPQPTLAQVQEAAGVPPGECLTMTKVLQTAVLNDAGMPQMMALVGGDWSAVEKTQAPLRALAMRRTNGNPTPALRAELVEESVVDAVAKFEANAEAQQQVRQHARAGADVTGFVRAVTRLALRALLDLAIDGPRPPHTSYAQAFRFATISRVGHALHFAERNIARNGASDVEAILNVAVQVAVREAVAARPDLAGVAGMAPMLVVPTLRQWQAEYTRAMRRPGDDGVLEMEMRRTVACSTRTSGTPATAAVAGQAAPAAAADEDALLDAALDEAAPAAGAANAASPSGGKQALAKALEGLPRAARDRILADADADVSAAVAPPPRHYFAGDKHDPLE